MPSISGSSEIGFAAAKILVSKNATVHVLDMNESNGATSWAEQLAGFRLIGRVDMVFPNAGVSKKQDYFARESFADDQESSYANILDVNLVAVLHTLTLARWSMRTHGAKDGNVVITLSTVAYAPERSLSFFSRSMASRQPQRHLVAPITAMGLPISDAMFMGRALYAATAKQDRRVEVYDL
ncbi:hypothetical protein GGR53DRAFT_470228 [Hypoxylon sp. FL1150]|nr:hypothetical protein GGR53DRAFT_470228 [Hypoxylon sp. FL1150]